MSQTSAARQPIPVGKYFLDRRKITKTQLELALQHREQFGLKLGQSLVELGFVTEADMVEALRHQARFPCVHLTEGIVDPAVARELGQENSRRLRAVAMNRIAKHVTVAMQDPDDAPVLEELAHLLDSKIFPVYAEASAIAHMTDAVFAPEGQLAVAPAPAPAARAAPTDSVRTVDAPARAERKDAAGKSEEVAVEAKVLDHKAPDEKAVVERVRSLLHSAFAQGVSDIHLEARRADFSVRFRIEGTLFEQASLPSSWAAPVIDCLKGLASLDEKESTRPAEGVISFLFKKEPLDVRVATTPSLHGESAVLTITGGKRQARTLADLDLAADTRERLEQLLASRHGLVLVTGPAESGKSTTLHAVLERLVGPLRKIITLESSVEHPLDGALQVLNDPEGPGFAASLRLLLRQDPDVVLVSEIADGATAQAILNAALSGRLVLSALRTPDGATAITRLLDMGADPYLLADALRGIVVQRLLRRLCPDCKKPVVPEAALLERLGLDLDGTTYFEGAGCTACHGTGYRGRIGIHEVLPITAGLRRLIERSADPEALHHLLTTEGLLALRADGLRRARAGEATLTEVLVATTRS